MSEKINITESSGNVFLDIGFSEEEAEYLQLKTELAFVIHLEENGFYRFHSGAAANDS